MTYVTDFEVSTSVRRRWLITGELSREWTVQFVDA